MTGDAAGRYFEGVLDQLRTAFDSQAEAVEQSAQMAADAIAADHVIYAFGATHGGILAQEIFYRAGGLVPVSPILPPGLTTDVRPIDLTSRMERLPGYAALVLDSVPIVPGDLLIVISVSGRNTVTVEMAELARSRGISVIAVTSLPYSRTVTSRAPSGKRLFEVADLVIDLGGTPGDALVRMEGLPQAVGPTSTVVGAALLNAWVARTAEKLLERGIEPPVFISANLDGGDQHNRRLLDKYRGRLTYL